MANTALFSPPFDRYTRDDITYYLITIEHESMTRGYDRPDETYH